MNGNEENGLNVKHRSPWTSTAFERHAQTALVLLLVALLLWVGNTTQLTAVTVAEMRVEVAYLKAAVAEPPVQYTEMSKRIDDVSKKVLILEEAVLRGEN